MRCRWYPSCWFICNFILKNNTYFLLLRYQRHDVIYAQVIRITNTSILLFCKSLLHFLTHKQMLVFRLFKYMKNNCLYETKLLWIYWYLETKQVVARELFETIFKLLILMQGKHGLKWYFPVTYMSLLTCILYRHPVCNRPFHV